MTVGPPEPGRRRIDRGRRQRLIEAALAVIEDLGVEGLSHRRVARQADVTLSATTYYFSSLEDLLVAAMEEAARRDTAALRDWFEGASKDADVAEVLTTFVFRMVTEQRRSAIVVSELYVAALRREPLRQVAASWNDAWIELLEPLVGRRAAEAASVSVGGLVMRVLLEPDTRPDEVTAVLRQVLATGPPPRQP